MTGTLRLSLFAAALGCCLSTGVIHADQWTDGSRFVQPDCPSFLQRLQAALGQLLTVAGSPGHFQSYATPQAAGTAAGFTVQVPTALPAGTSVNALLVTQRTMTVSANVAALGGAGLQELSWMPQQIQGPGPSKPLLQVTTTASPIVLLNYQSSNGLVFFAQAPSADIVVPPGVPLPVLTEIRLLLLGIQPLNAFRFAHAIDWRAAMLVPTPANVASVSEVWVGSNHAILVQGASVGSQPTASTLLWSNGSTLLGMQGTVGADALLALANSVH